MILKFKELNRYKPEYFKSKKLLIDQNKVCKQPLTVNFNLSTCLYFMDLVNGHSSFITCQIR